MAFVALLATACMAPTIPPPPRTPPASGPSEPQTSDSPAPPGPSGSPAGPATAAVVARFPLRVVAVADDGSDAWYVRDEGASGRIGHVTIDGGKPVEAAAGPVPVAIAAGPAAIYVLEGVPDDAPRKGLPRTGVVEKVDRRTLAVLASAPVPGLPVDVEVDDGRVWVGGVSGWIGSFDAGSLKRGTTAELSGQGSSMVSVGGGSVWMVNGEVADETFLVHRLDPGSGLERSTWNVPGRGVFGQVAVGDRVWVAGWHGDDYRLTPVSLTGEFGAPLTIRPVAAMRAVGGSLWVLPTAPAKLVRYDERSLSATTPVQVGGVGQDLAISGGHVWTAAEDLLALSAGP